jgi:hypothetical protein
MDELPSDPVRFVEASATAAQKILATHDDHEDLPDFLHHYTSGQGLLGILNSGEMHCTNVLYMNDSSEMDYGRELVLQILDERKRGVSPPVLQAMDRIPRMLEQPDFQYFVTCFCEKSDLLSQWRAYGAQAAGYSIGFSVEDLKTVLPEYSELLRVVYEPAIQEELVRHSLKQFLAIAETCVESYPDHMRLEDALTRWVNVVSNSLGRLIARMKSDVFAEEHEWRAVIIRFSFDTKPVQFRLAPSGIVVPYFPWRFRKQGIKPVRTLRHGPTVNPSLAIRSMGLLLHNLGYRDVNVGSSGIPLRF